jgi:hypothetical protein
MPRGAGAGEGDGFLHDGGHAAFIDVAHGEGADAGGLDVAGFEGVDVAEADEGDVARVDFGREAAQIDEFGGAVAGVGHASGMPWTLPLGARSRGVHVGMGVHPDDANGFVSLCEVLRDAADASRPRWSGRRRG